MSIYTVGNVTSGEVTSLAAATYGDFNNAGWASLDNGYYGFTATSAQLSNTPFKIEATTTYYIFVESNYNVISTVPYFTQRFKIFREGDANATPIEYERSFKTNIADFGNREWSGVNSFEKFASAVSATGLSFALTATNSKNLLDFMAESNEILYTNEGFKLLNTGGTAITNLLDETNDKYVFPSNLKTFGKTYVPYTIRVKVTGTVAGGAEVDEEYPVRLRRVVDDSIISRIKLTKVNSTTLNEDTANFLTFVNTETDPYVVDGMYIDILNNTGGSTLTITDVSILISKG